MSELVDDPLLLAQLLCTRLCHDLAGPVGAVAAGVELTSGDPNQVDAETLGLIGNSSAAASRKLKFLRTAMGIPAAPSALLGELDQLLTGYLQATAGRSGPAALQWPPITDLMALIPPLGAEAVPLILNLCLLAVESQPACQRLILEASVTPVHIAVTVEAEPQRAVAWRPDIEAAVANSGAPAARTIQAHFAGVLAARSGGKISLRSTETSTQAIFSIA